MPFKHLFGTKEYNRRVQQCLPEIDPFFAVRHLATLRRYGNSIFLRYLFLIPSTNWEGYGTPRAFGRAPGAGRPEPFHQSSMNFDHTEQELGARRLFVLACLVMVV